MQYGNVELCPAPRTFYICLNRTMQYGNLRNKPLMAIGAFQFKSYYVVWKPEAHVYIEFPQHCLNRTMQYGNRHRVCFPLEGKKSLNRTMQYGNRVRGYLPHLTLIKFKSYYVVWKPDPIRIFGLATSCLNRTMQYGNHRQMTGVFISIYSLNRTMQYGNISFSQKIIYNYEV